jgi:hypothetical protein
MNIKTSYWFCVNTDYAMLGKNDIYLCFGCKKRQIPGTPAVSELCDDLSGLMISQVRLHAIEVSFMVSM